MTTAIYIYIRDKKVKRGKTYSSQNIDLQINHKDVLLQIKF